MPPSAAPTPASVCARLPSPQSPDGGASVSVDIWSVGCIMAEMITGETLFKGSDRILYLELGAGEACLTPGAGCGGGLPYTCGGQARRTARAGWVGELCPLAPRCAPDLSQDLDQLKEIMKVTGTPPAEFVQRLQSAEVTGEPGVSWRPGSGPGGRRLTLSSHTGSELHERPPRAREKGFCRHPDQRKPSG